MLIIGEKINTVNSSVRRAVEERDAVFVTHMAVAQARAGADVIDVNVGGHPSAEPDRMRWAVRAIQEVVDLPLAVDSALPEAVCAGLEACRKKGQAWANSVTLEQARLDTILPMVAEYGCRVVGLCMDDSGIPATSDGRLDMAKRLVDEVQRWDVPLDKLYLDVLVQPLSVEPAAALVSLETIRAIRSALPEIRTVICLSAISYGLPGRRLLNRTFLPLLLYAGVDAVILDPLDEQVMGAILATRAILGRDACGFEYIAAYRSGQLGR